MQSEVIRTVRLYGPLGTKFGRVHRLAVQNAAEAVRALCTILPGFEKELMGAKDRGVAFAVFAGKRNLKETELQLPPGVDDIRIAPVIMGAKRGGIFSFILGAALIALAWWNPAGWVAAGSLLSVQTIGALGFSLALSGFAQMIAPQPKGLAGRDSAENGASYYFTGPLQVTAQGNPWPIAFGRCFGGSAIVSQGIYAEDQQ